MDESLRALILSHPEIDDRSFEMLLSEILEKVPQYSKEWTLLAPDDPGIGMSASAAQMVMSILERLNRFPEKVFVALLDVIGMRLQPPRPAETLLTFRLGVGRREGLWLPRGIRVAREYKQSKNLNGARFTGYTESDEMVSFETTDSVYVSHFKPRSLYGRKGYEYFDYSRLVIPKPVAPGRAEPLFDPPGFTPFENMLPIHDELFLIDERFEALTRKGSVQITFNFPFSRDFDLRKQLVWEFCWKKNPYDREYNWELLAAQSLPADQELGPSLRSIVIEGPLPKYAQMNFGKKDDRWVFRLRLKEKLEFQRESRIESVGISLLSPKKGVAPICMANLGMGMNSPLDMGQNFQPLGAHPKPDHSFMIACNEVFQHPKAMLELHFELSDPDTVPPALPSHDLVLAWEFWNGEEWEELARTTPTGTRRNIRHPSFVDQTLCFTRAGKAEFVRPDNWEPKSIRSEPRYWLRVRLHTGHFGKPGEYVMEGLQPVWREDHPIRPPSLRRVSVHFKQFATPIQSVQRRVNFRFQDVTPVLLKAGDTMMPFPPATDSPPTLYLGLHGDVPRERISIFFKVSEQARVVAKPAGEELDEEEEALQALSFNPDESGQTVVWQYWNGETWGNLLPLDGTKNLTETGFVQLMPPEDMQASDEFNEQLTWIRLVYRPVPGQPLVVHSIEDLRMNVVTAIAATIHEGVVLGSSDGTPRQIFGFGHKPVLPPVVLYVREPTAPSHVGRVAILREEGEDTIEQRRNDKGEITETWVRWHEVQDFFESRPWNRHFVIDYLGGTISFGDGHRGMIPPRDNDNIVARSFRTGGGASGNVPANTLNQLKQSLAYVQQVINPFPGVGGLETEDLDVVKLRGPSLIKNRNRAVTADDFEALALDAFGGISRANAFIDHRKPGEVRLLIVPRPLDEEGRSDEIARPEPSPELIKRVQTYLDERCQQTVKLVVGRPAYVPVSIAMDILCKKGAAKLEILRQEIERSVRTLLHPVVGGSGNGWPFGRDLLPNDIYKAVSIVQGIDHIVALRMRNQETRRVESRIRVQDHELIDLARVEVREVMR